VISIRREADLPAFRYIVIFSLLICGCGNAISAAPGDRSEAADQCPAPAFLLDGQCWKELADGEDCRVEPIIMELEDQPVYCPENSIQHPQQTKDK